jgi:hypothetical protein
MVTFNKEGCGSFYRKRSTEVPLSLAMWDDLQPREKKEKSTKKPTTKASK